MKILKRPKNRRIQTWKHTETYKILVWWGQGTSENRFQFKSPVGRTSTSAELENRFPNKFFKNPTGEAFLVQVQQRSALHTPPPAGGPSWHPDPSPQEEGRQHPHPIPAADKLWTYHHVPQNASVSAPTATGVPVPERPRAVLSRKHRLSFSPRLPSSPHLGFISN